jgi:hypothetical protein
MDAYRVLGVQPGDPEPVVRAAYRRFVIRYHPDHGGDPAKLQQGIEAFRRIRETPARASSSIEVHRGGMLADLLRRWDRRKRPPRVI